MRLEKEDVIKEVTLLLGLEKYIMSTHLRTFRTKGDSFILHVSTRYLLGAWDAAVNRREKNNHCPQGAPILMVRDKQ